MSLIIRDWIYMSTILVEEEETSGVPVCGANLTSPVIDRALFVEEVHYKIGGRLYIENAD
jgi:hypothetical protein